MPKTFVQKRAEILNLKIEDGKSPVTIVVTASDVIEAKKLNSKHCALARAAMRTPGVEHAYVFRGTAYLEYESQPGKRGRILRFKMPPSLQKEIVSFDRAKIFAPGQYHLTPPGPNMSREATAEYRKDLKKRKAAAAATARPEPARRPSVAATAAAKRAGLASTISKIEADEPRNPTREQKLFDAALKPIASPKVKQHRTQYIRDAKDPG